MELLLLLLLGVIAGIVAGLFGLGGGILFTPILFVVFSDAGIGEPVALTIATSLFCTFIAASGSTLRQYYQRNIYWREGIRVGLLGAVGVTLGRQVVTSPYYSKQEFVILFSLLLIYVSFMFYRRGSRETEGIEANGRPLGWRQVFVTGGLGGFVAVLAGIGGGGVMVPLMNLLYKKNFAQTVSISSLAIVLISLSGWLQLGLLNEAPNTLTIFHLGYVDFGAALPLAAGGLLGGFFGALFNLRIDRRYLQFGFSALAVAMAVKLLAEVF